MTTIDALRQIPDISSYPLSEALYKELGIPKPEIQSFQQYLRAYQTAIFHPSSQPGETRPPADDKIRILPTPDSPSHQDEQQQPQAS